MKLEEFQRLINSADWIGMHEKHPPVGVIVYLKGDDTFGDWVSKGKRVQIKHRMKFEDESGNRINPSFWMHVTNQENI